MGRNVVRSPVGSPSAAGGPLLIAVGLAGLVASAWLPGVPVVTSMAVLTLGATDATLARFRQSPALVSVTLLHAAVYLALYGMFIGATLHAAASGLPAALHARVALDLLTSTLPMAVAFRRVMGVLCLQGDAQQ
jgi:hypothetical protein